MEEEEESLSKYLYYNCKDIVCQDGDGNIMNGAKLDSAAYANNEVIVIRFRNGCIDGDVFNDDGTFKMALPAIEGKNHQEYWRKNKIHRDNGLPAIISGEPAQFEYWVDGVRQKASLNPDFKLPNQNPILKKENSTLHLYK